MDAKSVCTISIAVAAILTGYVWYGNKGMQRISRYEIDEVYDYIVVGAGSAGAIVAARLSENPKNKILVIEAGEEDIDFPAIFNPWQTFTLWGDPQLDWNLQTTVQRNACLSLENQKLPISRGKVLGGCSSHNCMFYYRGSSGDYDRWASLGCDGWSYEEVLPYFMKSENNQNKQYVASGYHGNSGPIVVSETNHSELHRVFIDAAKDLGYEECDATAGDISGCFAHAQSTMNKGKRVSTSTAYLHPAATYRNNLHVITAAQATRILFNGQKTAGVKFMWGGKSQLVSVRKEVVISAGTYMTPHLLMLSGIGPRSILENFKIPVIANLPVGENLKEHIQILEPHFHIKEPLSVTPEMAYSWTELVKYHLFGTGLLTLPCGAHASGFLKSKLQEVGDSYPSLHIMLSSFSWPVSYDFIKLFHGNSFNMNADVVSAMLQRENVNGHGFFFIIANTHPKSSGIVTLSSKNPSDMPIIDPRILSDEADIHVLIEGVRNIQKLVQTKPFQDIGAKWMSKPNPECSHTVYDSDSYWECSIRHLATSFFHPVGTCKMGRLDDLTAVVDPQLRVKGIQGLRVVDASVMPEPPSGPTAAVVMMIAEKAVDMIMAENY